MSYLEIAKKAEEKLKGEKAEATPLSEVIENKTIQAVKLCSHILEDEIWIILDRCFVPHDGLACYYPEEIPLLRSKTPEELRLIHKAKLVFPGCRVIQEGPDHDTRDTLGANSTFFS